MRSLDFVDNVNARSDLPPFRAGVVVLFRSRLGPGGAVHEALARFPLGGP